MNEWQALDQFWNSFGLQAYDENTVPDDQSPPYITYEAIVGQLDETLLLTASLWYRTTKWTEISEKAIEIKRAIGSGMGVTYDNGRLWVTQGDQFLQRKPDEDPQIRRIQLQINAEFQTSE